MNYKREHSKVFIWWGGWWAIQLITMWEFSFGIRIEPRRPLVDLFLGPVTIGLGKHPVLTDPIENTRHGGRGFFNGQVPADRVF